MKKGKKVKGFLVVCLAVLCGAVANRLYDQWQTTLAASRAVPALVAAHNRYQPMLESIHRQWQQAVASQQAKTNDSPEATAND